VGRQIMQQLLELRRQCRRRIQVGQHTTQGEIALRHHHPELGQQATRAIADG
jgi:hypothetical protein